jgi:hypothetical protein
VGALLVVTVIAVIIGLSGGSHSATPRPAPEATPVVQPLELIALAHEREADRLTVRGIVRNPAARSLPLALTAVVQIFSHDGALVGSGQGGIDVADLAPGAERTFVITVPTADEVARYRVSFRSDDTVVPHVDRRQGIKS